MGGLLLSAAVGNAFLQASFPLWGLVVESPAGPLFVKSSHPPARGLRSATSKGCDSRGRRPPLISLDHAGGALLAFFAGWQLVMSVASERLSGHNSAMPTQEFGMSKTIQQLLTSIWKGTNR